MQVILAGSDGAIRFKNAVERLSPKGNPRILLAVSGGPDSLAMLLLAHASMPDNIVAATVDHGLRPEAAEEADFVATLCAERTINHRILTPDQPITGNIQSAARYARYALLERAADELQCDLIATAHHSDDQLETMLMRLARGSGVNGLAGIRARNGGIIRPLLGFSKSELEQICANAGIEPVRDPSNADNDFDRVAMRQYLGGNPHPFDPARAARTASALADAVEALDWMTQQLAADRLTRQDEGMTLDANDLPRELQRRLVLSALRTIAPEITPRGDAVERLLDDLSDGKTVTISDILCKGGDVWHFSVAPPRRTG
ncbi:MAG: tRNA lysidine(34) synthetase TilS [Sphingorhabdus sp.]